MNCLLFCSLIPILCLVEAQSHDKRLNICRFVDNKGSESAFLKGTGTVYSSMKKPTSDLPNSNAFAGFMNSITSKFGVADAETQLSVDEALEGILSEGGVAAKVLPLKWGKIVIEAQDAPAAQQVRYLMTQIEDLLQERQVEADVVVIVKR